MSIFLGPSTVLDNLLLSIDLNNFKCYPRTGTIVTDSINRRRFNLIDSSYYTYADGVIQFTRTSPPTAKDGGGLHSTSLTSTSLAVTTFLYNNHTWEVWARIDDRTPGDYDATEGSSALALYQGYHSGFSYTASSITYNIWNGASSAPVCASWTLGTSGTQVIQGQWFQIAVTRSGNVFSPYINGRSLGTGSTTSLSATGVLTNNVLTLGKAYDVPAGTGTYIIPSKNTISQMRMYNKALSAKEVLQNFNAHRDRFGI